MAVTQEAKITCPHCGHGINIRRYTSGIGNGPGQVPPEQVERINKATDAAFKAMDVAFKAMDKAFAAVWRR